MNFLTRIFAAIVFSVGLLPSFGQETAPKEVVDKVSAETMAAAAKNKKKANVLVNNVQKVTYNSSYDSELK